MRPHAVDPYAPTPHLGHPHLGQRCLSDRRPLTDAAFRTLLDTAPEAPRSAAPGAPVTRLAPLSTTKES